MGTVIWHSVEHYRDAQADMRRWMIPIVGFLMILVLSIIIGVLAARGTRTFRTLKYLLLFHVVTQMVRHSSKTAMAATSATAVTIALYLIGAVPAAALLRVAVGH